LGAIARMVLHHLGMHGAGIFHLAPRRLRFQRHPALRAVPRAFLFHLRMHRAGVHGGGSALRFSPELFAHILITSTISSFPRKRELSRVLHPDFVGILFWARLFATS